MGEELEDCPGIHESGLCNNRYAKECIGTQCCMEYRNYVLLKKILETLNDIKEKQS